MEWNVRDLGAWKSWENTGKILRDGPGPIPLPAVKICWRRLRKLRDRLRKAWIIPVDPKWGHLTDWVLATLIARENLLLLGVPGTAKSEIATWTYRWLGLEQPEVDQDMELMPEKGNPYRWWQEREAKERMTSKYFHYQLSRFTQIEELFGPVEITLLRKGVLVRVNFAMITGAGVRGAFVDEIFKASGALLNSLLMLLNERRYFNWGGMRPADLACMIAASNEMPGTFSGLGAAAGGQFEDFYTLYALLDRLVIRLDVPLASGTSSAGAEPKAGDPHDTDLARATQKAIERESLRFTRDEHFEVPVETCLNDLLLVGRAMMQDETAKERGTSVFEPKSARIFHEAFLRTGAALQQDGTNIANGHITWTISPRKMKALFKVARAYALVTANDSFGDETANEIVPVTQQALWVFRHIWDTPVRRESLGSAVDSGVNLNWKEATRRAR